MPDRCTCHWTEHVENGHVLKAGKCEYCLAVHGLAREAVVLVKSIRAEADLEIGQAEAWLAKARSLGMEE